MALIGFNLSLHQHNFFYKLQLRLLCLNGDYNQFTYKEMIKLERRYKPKKIRISKLNHNNASTIPFSSLIYVPTNKDW